MPTTTSPHPSPAEFGSLERMARLFAGYQSTPDEFRDRPALCLAAFLAARTDGTAYSDAFERYTVADDGDHLTVVEKSVLRVVQ